MVANSSRVLCFIFQLLQLPCTLNSLTACLLHYFYILVKILLLNVEDKVRLKYRKRVSAFERLLIQIILYHGVEQPEEPKVSHQWWNKQQTPTYQVSIAWLEIKIVDKKLEKFIFKRQNPILKRRSTSLKARNRINDVWNVKNNNLHSIASD